MPHPFKSTEDNRIDIPFDGNKILHKRLVRVDSTHIPEGLGFTDADYKIFLKSPIKNVVRVDLTSCQIPYVIGNVKEGSNTFTIEETRTEGASTLVSTIDVVIPPGHYSESELLFDIERLLNVKSPAGGGYKVYFLRPRGKVVITFSNVYITKFVLKTTPLSAKLGFSVDQDSTDTIPGEDTDDVIYTDSVMANNYINVSDPGFLYLECPELQNAYTELSYDNKTIVDDKSVFAKITAETPAGSFIFYDSTKNYPIFKEFNPPLAHVDSLSLRWTDNLNQEVDFQGLNHSLTLMFTCEEYRVKPHSGSQK